LTERLKFAQISAKVGRMKQAILTVLLTLFFIISLSAQIKPSKTSVKPDPQKPKEITFQKVITPDGKTVILKSNGTWEFAPVEASEKPKAKPCDLTLKDAPVIRGFKLGMTKEEAEKVFGVPANTKENPFYFANPLPLPNGIIGYAFEGFTLSSNLRAFWDVRYLSLDFFDRELYSVTIKYSSSAASFTSEQFKIKISESFNLPIDAWVKQTAGERSYEILTCKEFQLMITQDNYLTATNFLISEKIKESEKYKRDVFKP
jgi:hypothetical protein